jgi:plasmid stabilization system protein ParE
MKVFYTPAALRDLDEIADWLAVTRQLLLPSSAESAW